MKVLIISADEEKAVGAKRVETSLRRKGIRVQLINLFEHIKDPLNSFILSKRKSRSLKHNIRRFAPTSVYICVHGLYEDVKTCYYGQFTTEQSEHMKPLTSAYRLGELLVSILPGTEEHKLDIKLLMCFGARTAEYARDHIKEIKKLNIFDSFGYRLFIQLARHNNNISMSAYLTETGCPDGEIQVEHEEAYALKQRKDRIAEERISIQNIYQNTDLSGDYTDRLMDQDYNLFLMQKSLEERKEKLKPKGIYGKINYIFCKNQCHIYFLHQGKTEILYRGPLKTKIPANSSSSSFVKNHPYLMLGGLGLLFAGTMASAYATYVWQDTNDESNSDLTFTPI